MNSEQRAAAKAADALVERGSALFAGVPPEVVGLVLAELVAMWIAAHLIEGEPEGTRANWERLQGLQAGLTRAMVPVHAKRMGTLMAAQPAAGHA